MKKGFQGFIAGIAAGTVITGAISAFAAYYTAVDNPFPVTYNGNSVFMQGYNIEDSTYFKLRDISDIVGGFSVGFEDNTIVLKSESGSDDNNTSPSNDIAAQKEIKYDTSFILDKYYSTGDWWRTTAVESFKITNIESSYSGDLKISYEMVATVIGDKLCNISVKCYDKDGFLIDSDMIIETVVDGQKFKIKRTMYIPPETVRLEFTDN